MQINIVKQNTLHPSISKSPPHFPPTLMQFLSIAAKPFNFTDSIRSHNMRWDTMRTPMWVDTNISATREASHYQCPADTRSITPASPAQPATKPTSKRVHHTPTTRAYARVLHAIIMNSSFASRAVPLNRTIMWSSILFDIRVKTYIYILNHP